jgi:hypothetical protein
MLVTSGSVPSAPLLSRSVFPGAVHLHLLELFEQELHVHGVVAHRVGDVTERLADRADDAQQLRVRHGPLRRIRPGLEDPEDHEQPHHAHDQIGEREDPLGAFFALDLFALAVGGHRVGAG